MSENIDNNASEKISHVSDAHVENIFISSVDSFSSSDVKCEPDGKRFKSLLPFVLRSAAMFIAFATFCYSVYSIFYRISDGNNQKALYDSLRPKSIPSAVEKSSRLGEPNKMPTLLEKLQINGDIDEYLNAPAQSSLSPEDYRRSIENAAKVNPDVYGWIVVTGTQIDYPIMLGDDNDYYLKHNCEREETNRGSIFADMSLSANHKDNYNALIYGHDMGDGSMFRGIRNWFKSENRKSLADNMEIQIYTKDALYVYKFFSAYESSDFNFTKTYFKDKNEYKSFLDSIYARSILEKKYKYNADETRICTLVTCTNVYANPDGRYVIHGILTKIVPYS